MISRIKAAGISQNPNSNQTNRVIKGKKHYFYLMNKTSMEPSLKVNL